ncbi:MAG TPA: N,N-dimethylformamidase beta subunit family domain-containing protein [Kineosporiaceae bacterium]
MSFTMLTTDQNIFYAVTPDGDLLWFADLARDGSNASDGSTGWAAASGNRIDTGWDRYSQIIAGGEGTLYALTPGGDLFWYQDAHRNGSPGWAPRSGSRIGVGWNVFSQVFSGRDGILYAVKPTGELLWYRDTHRDGTIGWDPHSGSQIGIGWTTFPVVFSDGGGVIYGISSTGDLRWYRDLRRDGRNGPTGSSGWDPRSGSRIGERWDVFVDVVPGGDGILYALSVDGFVLFYKDEARDGTSRWANGGVGRAIRSGMFLGLPADAAVQGYCVPMSAAPGRTVEVKASAATDYTVTVLRLKSQPDGSLGVPVAGPFHQAAKEQDVPFQAWRNGCNWTTSFTVTVGHGWRSGLYAAHCQATDGSQTYVPFVVTPDPSERARIAVLASTNTWSAYNDWGGESKYSLPSAALLSFERPNPSTSPVDDGQLNHLTRAELWVLGWLEDAGFAYDLYTEWDFHSGIPDLGGYRALVLSTHPEYWTPGMLDTLQEYLAGGGCLVYLGGNGIFERVDFTDDGRHLVLFGGDAASSRARSYFRNLTPPRPERAVLGVAYRYDSYLTFAPYRVLLADHPFLADTGLRNGDLIGAQGRNGAASGWEMDTSIPGHAPAGQIVSAEGDNDRGAPPAGLQLLARGTNPGYGADMTSYETGAGGFVFATGSISFGGSLVQDAALGRIVSNALQEALARGSD